MTWWVFVMAVIDVEPFGVTCPVGRTRVRYVCRVDAHARWNQSMEITKTKTPKTGSTNLMTKVVRYPVVSGGGSIILPNLCG